MKDHRGIVLVFLLCLVAGTESKSEKPGPVCSGTKKQLMNTVVKERASFSFSNRFDSEGVKWEIAPSYIGRSTSSYAIAVNNTVEPPYVGDYTVNTTHLNIPVVTDSFLSELDKPSTTGLYTLTYKTDGCQSMANLIEVFKGPECGCAKSDSDNAELLCELRYSVTQYPHKAKIIWTTDCGQACSGTLDITTNHDYGDTAMSSLSIKSSDAAKFTCFVSFTAPNPSGPANMATNAPSFNASCTQSNCVKKDIVIEENSPKNCAKKTKEKSQKESKSGKDALVCDLNKQLMNTVVNEGDPISFSNQPDTKGVVWEIVPPGTDNAYLIADNNALTPQFVDDYDYTVDSTHLNLSFVTSFSGTEKLPSTGLYMLTYRTDGCQWMANLIVVKGKPVCDCLKTETDSNNAVLMCQIKYAVKDKYPNHAKFMWNSDSAKADSGKQKIFQSGDDEYTAVSNHSITSSDAANITCVVTFTAPDPSAPANMAKNEPSFKESFTIANCVKKETVKEEKSQKDSKPEQLGPVCSDQDQKLMNKVVRDKDSSTFSNRRDPKGVKWEILPTKGDRRSSPMSSNTIADNNAVEPQYVDEYAVNTTHLNIPEVTDNFPHADGKPKSPTTGLYTLTYKTGGCQSMANLIAIYNGPTCSCREIDSESAVLKY